MKVKKPLATKFWKRTRGLGEVYRLHWLSARGLRRKDGAKQTALFIVPKLGSKVASVCSTPTPLLKFKELIPKMMGFKMYLRLQIWLFWGIHVSFRRCTHFNQFFLKSRRVCVINSFKSIHLWLNDLFFVDSLQSIHRTNKVGRWVLTIWQIHLDCLLSRCVFSLNSAACGTGGWPVFFRGAARFGIVSTSQYAIFKTTSYQNVYPYRSNYSGPHTTKNLKLVV